MVLLRQLLGDVLRRLRIRQGRTLREVSASARVSLGYLSEVERGRKEASSELLAAICAALETPLSQVFREVSDNFALAELQQDAVLGGPREPAMRLGDAGLRLGDPALRVSEASLRLAGDRVPVPAEQGPASPADLAGVGDIDVQEISADGFTGHDGQIRDMVTV
jgi:XRE family transcriptional regulator, stress-response regulator